MLFKKSYENSKVLSRGKRTEQDLTATTKDVVKSLFSGKYCKADILKHLRIFQAYDNATKIEIAKYAKITSWLLEELDGTIYIRLRELCQLLELNSLTAETGLETISILAQYKTPEIRLGMSSFNSINQLIKQYKAVLSLSLTPN